MAVYRSKRGEPKFVKGEVTSYLLRGSIVTLSLEAAIINTRFANAQPFRRIEKDFEQNGVAISEQNMASWTIKCSQRYLSRFYEYLHVLLKDYHVFHADETTVEVVKDGRLPCSEPAFLSHITDISYFTVTVQVAVFVTDL